MQNGENRFEGGKIETGKQKEELSLSFIYIKHIFFWGGGVGKTRESLHLVRTFV